LLCNEPMVDTLEFEAGNNAEVPVQVPLCDAHLREAEELDYDFQVKHADKIEALADEVLIERMDGRSYDL
jgi:hypothetical protein